MYYLAWILKVHTQEVRRSKMKYGQICMFFYHGHIARCEPLLEATVPQ